MNPSEPISTEDTGYTRFFGLNLAALLAEKITAVEPNFPTESFMADAKAAELTERRLLERVDLLATLLREHLPEPYPEALNILTRILGPENPHETGMFTFGYWLWPVGAFIGTYGLDDFELSIARIEELTKRHTGEYAIRPYINAYPRETCRIMQAWASSANVHVRRLASEGLRPRLPWAQHMTIFLHRPAPVFDVLETLKDDPSRFVQKSVANNVNDFLKDNRPAAMTLMQHWAQEAQPQRLWLIRHALRNEIKRGAADALATLESAHRGIMT